MQGYREMGKKKMSQVRRKGIYTTAKKGITSAGYLNRPAGSIGGIE